MRDGGDCIWEGKHGKEDHVHRLLRMRSRCVHHRRITVSSKSWWKSTIYIPVEPVLSQDHEYIINFINQLLYKTNRRKRKNGDEAQIRKNSTDFQQDLILQIDIHSTRNNLQHPYHNLSYLEVRFPTFSWNRDGFGARWSLRRRNRCRNRLWKEDDEANPAQRSTDRVVSSAVTAASRFWQ